MRITENRRVIETMPNEFKGTTADIANQLSLQTLRVLADMSKSLAIIADTLKAQQKSARRTETAPRTEGGT